MFNSLRFKYQSFSAHRSALSELFKNGKHTKRKSTGKRQIDVSSLVIFHIKHFIKSSIHFRITCTYKVVKENSKDGNKENKNFDYFHKDRRKCIGCNRMFESQKEHDAHRRTCQVVQKYQSATTSSRVKKTMDIIINN